ncbi:GLPGLI family protein [Chryseobacterium gotjawalense]|uniref:GLPGLI family protein n=1 Tax=Chryseobacterium gotjawalense TaxID=3042315 RepID=A0ABY8RF37_9FLAO|nr:GLPGLI family protein [Chryseobacterium sp. wdc7]WHF52590.1 GLPGLI family protein [Chryseobacterium sp. wdc7]
MQKSSILFIFSIVSASLFSQNYRIGYEYSFKMDSLNRNLIEKELMNLDITREGSNFYSNEKFIYDSLINVEMKRAESMKSRNMDISNIPLNYKIDYSVTKKYPNFETNLHTAINGDEFSVLNTDKLSWNILADNKEIEGFKAQKAMTEFGGRKWIAWFTTEIAIQDGPYKFNGLPGLILNIEDEKGDHIFKFVGSKKITINPTVNGDSKVRPVEISAKKFTQIWKEYTNDPTKKIRQIFSQNSEAKLQMFDNTGRELSKQEILKIRDQQAKEKLKRNNNFLELSLYQ